MHHGRARVQWLHAWLRAVRDPHDCYCYYEERCLACLPPLILTQLRQMVVIRTNTPPTLVLAPNDITHDSISNSISGGRPC